MSPASSTKSALQVFVAKATGAALLVVSVVSGLLAIFEVVNAKYLAVAVVAVLGLCGWAAAFYISYTAKNPKSSAERLLDHIAATLPIPYLETWLRSTLLSQDALDQYWHADPSLAVDEIQCDTVLTANDARLRVAFKGSNAARNPVEFCPMAMFGGSVIHLPKFPQSAASLKPGGGQTPLYIRKVLDLGQFHYVEILFSVPVARSEEFNIEHHHSWPGGMAAGEDTLWYPYAAFFEREPTRMVISVAFTEPPTFLRGVCASMTKGRCDTVQTQPRAAATDGTRFEWIIDPVDNDSIYGLVFRRD